MLMLPHLSSPWFKGFITDWIECRQGTCLKPPIVLAVWQEAPPKRLWGPPQPVITFFFWYVRIEVVSHRLPRGGVGWVVVSV